MLSFNFRIKQFSINRHLHILGAVSLIVSPSTLLQRSSFNDYGRATSWQRGDVDGRPGYDQQGPKQTHLIRIFNVLLN